MSTENTVPRSRGNTPRAQRAAQMLHGELVAMAYATCIHLPQHSFVEVDENDGELRVAVDLRVLCSEGDHLFAFSAGVVCRPIGFGLMEAHYSVNFEAGNPAAWCQFAECDGGFCPMLGGSLMEFLLDGEFARVPSAVLAGLLGFDPFAPRVRMTVFIVGPFFGHGSIESMVEGLVREAQASNGHAAPGAGTERPDGDPASAAPAEGLDELDRDGEVTDAPAGNESDPDRNDYGG